MLWGTTIAGDPVLFRVGPLQLRWYGLFVALATFAYLAFYSSGRLLPTPVRLERFVLGDRQQARPLPLRC